jgi:hypothetical protein
VSGLEIAQESQPKFSRKCEACARSFGRSLTTAIMERTSPAEPRAMARNESSSLLVTRSKPSATPLL